MKHILTFLISIVLIMKITALSAQETVEPYTARAYWLEEQNSIYQNILSIQKENQALSAAQEQYLEDYRGYLKTYFSKLSQEEQEKYFEFKSQWEDELVEKSEEEDSDITEMNRAGIKPGRKFLLSNGIYGFGYGLVVDAIFEVEPPLAVAIPFLSSGISMLLPLANPGRYEGINFGTVLLARHGKFIGALHGSALGLLITGNPDEFDNAGKIIAGSALVGSIGLGELGFQLGKRNNWSEGRISTYRYYSLIGPGLTFAGLIAGNVDDARIYGGATLISGGLSYLYANHVYEKNHFSRGDILAASSFALLSTAFGFGWVDVTDRWEILVPAATLIGGTFANHALLKNAQLSSKQGWNVNYVTGAMSIIGLGITALFQPYEHHAYFLVPSSLGMLAWIGMTTAQKKKNIQSRENDKNNWVQTSINITPQNYFLNKQWIPSSGSGVSPSLPMFSLRVNF